MIKNYEIIFFICLGSIITAAWFGIRLNHIDQAIAFILGVIIPAKVIIVGYILFKVIELIKRCSHLG